MPWTTRRLQIAANTRKMDRKDGQNSVTWPRLECTALNGWIAVLSAVELLHTAGQQEFVQAVMSSCGSSSRGRQQASFAVDANRSPWRGGKHGLSNKPIFPQPPCLSQQQNTAKNLKLTQVEHACSGFAWWLLPFFFQSLHVCLCQSGSPMFASRSRGMTVSIQPCSCVDLFGSVSSLPSSIFVCRRTFLFAVSLSLLGDPSENPSRSLAATSYYSTIYHPLVVLLNHPLVWPGIHRTWHLQLPSENHLAHRSGPNCEVSKCAVR